MDRVGAGQADADAPLVTNYGLPLPGRRASVVPD